MASCLLACDENDAGHAHDESTGEEGGCADEERAISLGVGTSIEAGEGRFVAELLDMSPAPPARYENDWILRFVDPEGLPLEGVALTATPFMPDHDHGSNAVPEIEGLGAGEFHVRGMNLHMSGFWELRFTLAGGADETAWSDTAVFPICVP